MHYQQHLAQPGPQTTAEPPPQTGRMPAMGLIANLRNDWKTVTGLRRTLKWLDGVEAGSDTLVPDDFERAVDKHRANVAFRFEGTIVTYGELEARANRFAHWARAQGLKPGDVVAVFMENRPDYVAAWIGLSKVGVASALINVNLMDRQLAHCINIADVKVIITGEEQDEAIASADGLLEGNPPVWTLGGTVTNAVRDLEAALAAVPDTRPDRSAREGMKAGELCLYVYTSGTTGLPKAARLTHSRTRGMMRTFIAATGVCERDRTYVTLPLYHSTGGICGIGIALMTGGSVILRRKFSASQFWDEASEQGATAIVYIGELCRYLLNQPPNPKERAHRIRTGFGNGLRPEVWQRFLDRFGIPHLAEFYGSTEGNVSFVNFDGHVGAVGRIPKFLESKFAHIRFVKFDVETEAPLRGSDGFCIETGPDEPGEVLGRIGDDTRQRFEGYQDKEATQKKILRDVFEPGDMWYRTGDLMKKDARGYVYFVDRIGDTFRWKGENVATNEVGEVLSEYPGVETANAYGVTVPGTDGRAGMAAITGQDIDFDGLYRHMHEHLPAYAVPLFLRLQRQVTDTATFKYRKVDLVNEGFDPEKVDDPVWFADPEAGTYVPLTREHYETLVSGGYRF